MDSFCVLMIFACFFPNSSADILADSETGRTASTVVKEGLSAEIFCMVEGTGDYFWSKGESFQTSILVASFTGGNGNKDNEPYAVTVNGTLSIRKVTLKDEGIYFCRFTSVENECHGKIKVIVQASLSNFFLAIDRCDRESSCLLYLNPSQSISLTCAAQNAPPLMTLKWFNGSKEITEGIEQNEILPQNGNSREITSTVAAVYGHTAFLTCQAVDPKRSNDDVRFVHAQVEMKVPAHETLPSWVIVSVTLAGCFIVFGIVLLIKAKVNRKHRKKYEKLKREDVESLTKKVNTNEETINAKHQKLTEFKVSAESKDSELSELKSKLRQTEQELKISRNDNIELQTKVAKDKAKNISAEEDLASKAKLITELETKLQLREEEIKKANEENFELLKMIASNEAQLTAAKTKVSDQIQEMSTLKEDVRIKAKVIADLEKNNSIAFEKEKLRITAAKEKVHTKANEITELKDKLKQQEEEINKERNANVKLRGNLTERDDALRRITIKLEKLKAVLKGKNVELLNTSKELADLKEEFTKLEELYKNLKGVQQGSQKKPGKKRQGNDGD